MTTARTLLMQPPGAENEGSSSGKIPGNTPSWRIPSKRRNTHSIIATTDHSAFIVSNGILPSNVAIPTRLAENAKKHHPAVPLSEPEPWRSSVHVCERPQPHQDKLYGKARVTNVKAVEGQFGKDLPEVRSGKKKVVCLAESQGDHFSFLPRL
eukprot:PhF_6_TR32724/c0_g1_i1/m.48286